MQYRKSLNEIKRDLQPFQNYWVVLYGSYVTGTYTPRSDIDVAIITKEKDPRRNRRILFKLLSKVKSDYDLRIFELLPLHIKAEVMDNYIVVFGDPLDIAEYFYFYRKIWKDMKWRYLENQYSTYKEILDGIKRWKKIVMQKL